MANNTGSVLGTADRRGWCDLRPGPKAEEARDMWRRARRSDLRLELVIKIGNETRIATIVSCRRMPSGGVRLRF